MVKLSKGASEIIDILFEEQKHFMVEDDIIAREDMRKLTKNRLSSFNINKANNGGEK